MRPAERCVQQCQVARGHFDLIHGTESEAISVKAQRLADLAEVSAADEASRESASTAPVASTQAHAVRPTPAAGTPAAPLAAKEILTIIESLAALREKNIITEAEFSAKKAELLSRL